MSTNFSVNHLEPSSSAPAPRLGTPQRVETHLPDSHVLAEQAMPDLDSYLERASALELARRSLVGAPVYAVISLIMLLGTPIHARYGRWVWLEAFLLVFLAAIRMLYARGFERRYAQIGEKAVVQFGFLTALQSLTLGVLAAMAILNYWAAHEAVLTIVLSAGCIAAGTSAMSVRHSAQYIFLGCVLAPLGIAVFLVGGLMKAVLIVGFLLLMAVLVQDGGEARRTYLQKLRDHYRELTIRRRISLENQGKRQYLAGVAHDIRSPVYSIIGMSSLLSNEHMSEYGKACLVSVRHSCDALLRLVSSIPGATKAVPQGGGSENCLASLNLGQLIQRVSELYKVEAICKGLEFKLELEALPESVLFAEEESLEQVLANLLANAVTFTDQGCITLTARSRKLSDGGLRVDLEIADTGIGVPVKLHDSLFDPFSENGIHANGRKQGKGFGLPMCRELVHHMGGELKFVSQEGVGTQVSFFVPMQAHPANSEDRTDAFPVVGAGASTPIRLGMDYPHDILVVDDDEVHRHILCAYLAKCGYSADQAGDGQQAIDALRKKDFDLVFMDLRMPVMGGLEATRWIREHFDNHKWRLHIIALTADAALETRSQCLSAGFDHFLSKPVLGNELVRVLRKRRKLRELAS